MKTKALISCEVTSQFICTFGFAYAKSRFSFYVAQLILISSQVNQREITNFAKDSEALLEMGYFSQLNILYFSVWENSVEHLHKYECDRKLKCSKETAREWI